MYYYSLVIIQVLSVVLLLAESIYVFCRMNSKKQALLFLYTLATLINNFGYLIEIISKSAETALVGTKFSYLGKAFLTLAFFVMVMKFCNAKIPQKVYYGLSIIHGGIFLLVLFCEYHNLYFTGWTFVREGLFPHNKFEYGIFYFFFMSMLALYLFSGLVVLIRSIRKEKNKKRRSIQRLLLICVFIELAGFLLFFSGITGGYDATSLSYAICTVFMYIAIFKHGLLNSMDLAKDYALDNLAEGVVAVENDSDVVYYNGPAKAVLPNIQTDSSGTLQALRSAVEKKENIIVDGKVFHPQRTEIFKQNELRAVLYSLADVTESYYHNRRLEEDVAEKTHKLLTAQQTVITGMATMIEGRDSPTGGHIKRTSGSVSAFTGYLYKIGAYPERTEEYYRLISKAAPMHDLGKIAVEDAVLRKPGKFTPEEFEKMKCHCAKGAGIVAEILKDSDNKEFKTVAVNIANFHHEKWDGSGYPNRLSGKDIPFEARVMALADVFDALVSKRCYKESFSYDKAFEIIADSLGSHFDPELGSYFIQMRPKLELLYNKYNQSDRRAETSAKQTAENPG